MRWSCDGTTPAASEEHIQTCEAGWRDRGLFLWLFSLMVCCSGKAVDELDLVKPTGVRASACGQGLLRSAKSTRLVVDRSRKHDPLGSGGVFLCWPRRGTFAGWFVCWSTFNKTSN